MALSDQIVESQTLTDSAVGAASKTFTGVTVSQAPGAGASGRFQLHAAVVVSSGTADVTITGITVGSEAMAPDRDGVATASGRPAARMFTAGEWATGSQSVVVQCSGGNIDAIAVELFVLEEVAEECLPPFGSAPRSDTFNRLSLNSIWTFDPADNAGATFALSQVSGIIRGTVTLPGVAGDYGDEGGNRSPNLAQDIGNVDFSITTNQEQTDTAAQMTTAIHAEIAADSPITFIRGGTYTFGGSRFDFMDQSDNGTFTFLNDAGATGANEDTWYRFIRDGNNFAFANSANGSTFNAVADNDLTFTVGRVGWNAGIWGGTTGAAIDIFQFIDNNAAVARTPQDAQTALQFLSNTGAAATSISLAFTEDTTEGAALFDFALVAASGAAGEMAATGTGAEVVASGLVSSTNSIRYAIVGVLKEVSGTTAGETIGASWTGAANASAVGGQFRVEALIEGTSVDVGIAAETDTAQPITPSKAGAIGIAAETDAGQEITPSKSGAAGTAEETDTAGTVTPSKSGSAGTAEETESAEPITPDTGGQAVAAGTAAETDAGQPVTPSKTGGTGTATESDSAQAVSPDKSGAAGTAEETDTAGGATASKASAVGIATETDEAIDISAAKTGAVGTAEETDDAQAIGVGGKIIEAGTAAETDSAESIAPSKAGAVGTAVESDDAQAIAPGKVAEAGPAAEADSGQPITPSKSGAIGTAGETDTAEAIGADGATPIGAAGETDAAGTVTPSKASEAGTAAETDAAQPITPLSGIAAGTAAETDDAGTITPSKTGAIGTAAETDQAQGAAPGRAIPAGTATETDQAQAATPSKTAVAGTAGETDSALPVGQPTSIAVGTATETDTAIAIAIGRRAPTVTIIGQAKENITIIGASTDVD